MFCPGDDTSDPVEELAKIANCVKDDLAFCSYFYRQLDARDQTAPPRLRLDNLGTNGEGNPVSALLMDANSLLVLPGLVTRTNHGGEKVGIGFAEGHVKVFDNSDGTLTLTGGEVEMLTEVKRAFRHADTLR